MRRLAALPAALLLSSCAAIHNLTPLSLAGGPAAQTDKSPEFSPAKYSTFSVFPLSAVNAEAQTRGEAVEKSLLFFLRNALEAKGYRFVPLGAQADLLVTADAGFTYMKTWDAGRPLSPPPVAGQLVPSAAAAAALGPGAARDGLAARGFGQLAVPDSALDLVPAYPPAGASPPVSGGWFQSVVNVRVLDASSLGEIWAGSGLGLSRTPDLL
ncbi:MAG: hypothetical protein AAB368_00935, partial [bacterium]